MADRPETKPVEPPKPNQDLPKSDTDRPHPEPHPGDPRRPHAEQLPADKKRRQEEEEAEEKEKKEALEKIQKILGDFGGAESNIPITHEYWVLLNQYRAKKG
jgi:hypothetical protein